MQNQIKGAGKLIQPTVIIPFGEVELFKAAADGGAAAEEELVEASKVKAAKPKKRRKTRRIVIRSWIQISHGILKLSIINSSPKSTIYSTKRPPRIFSFRILESREREREREDGFDQENVERETVEGAEEDEWQNCRVGNQIQKKGAVNFYKKSENSLSTPEFCIYFK